VRAFLFRVAGHERLSLRPFAQTRGALAARRFKRFAVRDTSAAISFAFRLTRATRAAARARARGAIIELDSPISAVKVAC
jgi:hypothetical protein